MNDFAQNLVEKFSPIEFTKPHECYTVKKQSKLGAVPASPLDHQWLLNLNNVRHEVISILAFSMGIEKLLEQTEFINAISQRNYEKAADQMLDTDWAAKAGRSAFSLARLMKLGAE